MSKSKADKYGVVIRMGAGKFTCETRETKLRGVLPINLNKLDRKEFNQFVRSMQSFVEA